MSGDRSVVLGEQIGDTAEHRQPGGGHQVLEAAAWIDLEEPVLPVEAEPQVEHAEAEAERAHQRGQ
ncbi:hypothetical protein [Nocardia farcinica]|uniref:hypothetical protein n=1 Tax=Nocardia farcinica TaxID=37329 RepID=UPI0037B2EF60